MRKHQQQQLFELLQTIKQAQLKELYSYCQEGALAVGKFIEAIEGEGTDAVTLLEEYCELLFKASIGEVGQKQLEIKLNKVELSVKNQLKPNRIEIAFLSYNASMSDSIESIYDAAKNDPNCDCYWIPIPFFERNNDGTLGKMHCESADCYGDGIECTNWQQYDIEGRHPDVIFTFAPYDMGNYVTTIHPHFYCERLREFTDLLVYVPYFVAGDDVQEHFCTLAGCVYAHKVIVETKKVRDTYARVFKRTYGDRLGRPEDKFIALGSPKYDAVTNTKRQNCQLPAQWLKSIGDKTVILYNTSIGTMLVGNEQYLKKLRSVFAIFRKRNDVLLWWRPHPLNEATYKSMRPQLLKEYERLIAEYKDYGFVYDDTANLHRAIACADAYLGDGSSLVSLFSVTGKPIMIQDINTLSDDGRKDALIFEGCYDDGEHIWFAAYWFNGLFKCSKETWVAEYLGCFPGEKRNGQRLFSDVVECSGKLYFAPMTAEQIAIYDMASGAFDRIELREVDTRKHKLYLSCRKFLYLLSTEDYVYLLPATYPAIVRVSSENQEIEYIDDWVSKAGELRNNNVFWFGISTCTSRREIVVPFLCADALLAIDCSTSKTQIIPLNTNDIGYVSMCLDGNDFWLSPSCKQDANAHVVKWNRESKEIENIDLSKYGGIAFDRESINCFIKMFQVGGKVYAMPQHCDTAFCIDTSTKTIEIIDIFSTKFVNKELIDVVHPIIPSYWICETTIYGLGINSGAVYSFNIDEKTSSYTKISADMRKAYSNANMKDPNRCVGLDDCIYYDGNFNSIDAFLDMVVNGAIADEAYEKQLEIVDKLYMLNGGESGKKIYEYCKTLSLK